jgi:3-oxoadipate enol-lactonase
MADYADDAAALIEFAGWKEANVAGASFGGMVAQELTLRHPTKVKRLVLLCTSPGGEGGTSFPFHEIDHMSRAERARHMLPIADTRHDAVWAEANREQYEFLLKIASTDPYSDEPNRAMGARRQLEARAKHDTWDRLSQIKCPVMIAAGKYDGIATPQSQRNMASRIPCAELHLYEGGHMFMLQDRAAFADMIAFLNG